MRRNVLYWTIAISVVAFILWFANMARRESLERQRSMIDNALKMGNSSGNTDKMLFESKKRNLLQDYERDNDLDAYREIDLTRNYDELMKAVTKINDRRAKGKN